MRPTLMGLLAKNAEICPCVRPARKGKPARGSPPVRIG